MDYKGIDVTELNIDREWVENHRRPTVEHDADVLARFHKNIDRSFEAHQWKIGYQDKDDFISVFTLKIKSDLRTKNYYIRCDYNNSESSEPYQRSTGLYRYISTGLALITAISEIPYIRENIIPEYLSTEEKHPKEWIRAIRNFYQSVYNRDLCIIESSI